MRASVVGPPRMCTCCVLRCHPLSSWEGGTGILGTPFNRLFVSSAYVRRFGPGDVLAVSG
jgi:hypothetical protein